MPTNQPQDIRRKRLQQLAALYPGDWTPDIDGAPYDELAEGRFALILDRGRHTNPGAPHEWWISTHDTLTNTLDLAANYVLEQDHIYGIVDLDTGDSHGVHVSTPTVTARTSGVTPAPDVPWASGPAGPEPVHVVAALIPLEIRPGETVTTAYERTANEYGGRPDAPLFFGSPRQTLTSDEPYVDGVFDVMGQPLPFSEDNGERPTVTRYSHATEER